MLATPRWSRFALFAILAVIAASLAEPSSASPASGGSEVWVSTFAHLPNFDTRQYVAASPDGAQVFVTGGTQSDYTTIAYTADTGTEVWTTPFRPGTGTAATSGIAVSPDGSKVFVTGSEGAPSSNDWATVAFEAATGAILWARRYNGPANGDDRANDIAVSGDGSAIYVTGQSDGWVATTIAYDTTTGAVRWLRRYSGTISRTVAVAASPDGSEVFAVGVLNKDENGHFLTIAYNAATGDVLWVALFSNHVGPDRPSATAVAVSPDGSKVFVTGFVERQNRSYPFTFAYGASTGAVVWHKQYGEIQDPGATPTGLAVSPDGMRVLVTGSAQTLGADEIVTFAYGASNGFLLWDSRYTGPARRGTAPVSLAVSPNSSWLYVTGWDTEAAGYRDYITLALAAPNGTMVWVRRYNGAGANGDDTASSVAPSPDGSKIFVTGQSLGITTIAYAA
jgi:DNA-binding beta-propeller fold protein YncE